MVPRGRLFGPIRMAFLVLLLLLPYLSATAQEPLLGFDRSQTRSLDEHSAGSILILRKEGGLTLLNPLSGKEIGSFEGTNLMVATTADGTWAAAGSAIGSVRIWNSSTGKNQELPVIGPYHMEFAPTGKALLIASLDGTVLLWNPETASEIFHTTGARISSIAILEDWKTMAAGNRDGTITLWDLQKGIPIFSFPAHRDRITDILFLPSIHRFVTLGEDGSVKIWYSRLDEFLGQTSEEYRKKAEEYRKRAEELEQRAKGVSGNDSSTRKGESPKGTESNGGKKTR